VGIYVTNKYLDWQILLCYGNANTDGDGQSSVQCPAVQACNVGAAGCAYPAYDCVLTAQEYPDQRIYEYLLLGLRSC
jgi:hypothetical protein